MGINVIRPILGVEIIDATEENIGGTVTRDTDNTFYSQLGEVNIKKGNSSTYIINTYIEGGSGTLKLYNFTTKADILEITVDNTSKERKTGTISQIDLVSGNNVIELWGKNTGGTINVSSYQIKTK